MDAAVSQFAVMQVGLLGTLTGLLGYAGYLLALLLGLQDLLEDDIGHLGILVQQVIDLLLDKITYKLIERYATVGTHGGGAQLNLGLALKHRLFDVYGYCSHYAVTDITRLKVLAVKFLYGTCYMLLECTLMSAAL